MLGPYFLRRPTFSEIRYFRTCIYSALKQAVKGLSVSIGEHSFTSLISRSISHLEFFWVSGLSHLPFQIHKRYIRRIRTRDPMISRRTLSPLDYRTVAAEATENLWYLCTVAGPNPDPDPNPRGGGQLPNPKSAILR